MLTKCSERASNTAKRSRSSISSQMPQQTHTSTHSVNREMTSWPGRNHKCRPANFQMLHRPSLPMYRFKMMLEIYWKSTLISFLKHFRRKWLAKIIKIVNLNSEASSKWMLRRNTRLRSPKIRIFTRLAFRSPTANSEAAVRWPLTLTCSSLSWIIKIIKMVLAARMENDRCRLSI